MKIRVLLATLAVAGFLSAPNAISAEQYIYKWKDAQGMVHYTERPPEPGVAFEKVRRTTDKGQKEIPVRAPQQSASNDDSTKDDSYNSWRRDNCKIATQNLDVLQNASRIAQDDGQGGKRLMTDEEKAAQIKKMTEQQQKYCESDSDS